MLDFTHQSWHRRTRPTLSLAEAAVFFAAGDLIVILFSGLVGPAAYQLAIGQTVHDFPDYVGLALVAGLVHLALAYELKLYRLPISANPTVRIAFCWLATVLFVTFVLFIFKASANISRGGFLAFIGISLGLLLLSRFVTNRTLRNAQIGGAVRGRRTILIGIFDELASLSQAQLLVYGIDAVGSFTLPAPESEAASASRHDNSVVDAVLKKAREVAAEQIALVFPWVETPQLNAVCLQLRATPLPVRLVPDRFVRNRVGSALGPAPLIEIQPPPLSRLERFCKRTFDLIAASVFLILLMPVMIMTATAIKCDGPGPVIFRQRRMGFDGREFVFYKFRTMNVQEDGPSIVQAQKGDARTTRLGRLLRQSSIDELPQLVNVILGHMSMVGPRPHALAHDFQYRTAVGDYAFRHHVKPGITGWAQVNGHRGATTVQQMKTRVAFDLWYINHWSVSLDLWILAKSVIEVARARNAY